MSEQKRDKSDKTNDVREKKKPKDRGVAPQRKKDADVTDEHETERKEGTKELSSPGVSILG